ncbi:MAG: efflux RND transporter periplasmic adaptor subunit [Rhodothermales bacterium]
MTTPMRIAGILLLLALVGAGGYFAGRHGQHDEMATPADAAPAGKIAYWRAPMDPTEIYDAPGKSRMGMDLIPVYEDEADTASKTTVSIDPSVVQNMGVRTARVERTDFSRMIRTVGEVQYDEERLYQVSARISGWIETLHVNYVGDQVRQGSPLLDIYSPELVATQQEFVLALANARRLAAQPAASMKEDAERLLSSARKRLAYWDIPADEIERLEQTGEVRKTITLRAPATGVVIQKDVVDGAHIKAGDNLVQIADLRTVWVHASFYENEVPWIEEGQPVEMELSYLPGKTYSGRLAYVYPYLREKARDVHVRIVVSNPDLELKPGMYTNVQVQGAPIQDALVIPTEAVIRSGERSLVFVVRAPGSFEPREVRIGEEGGPNNAFVRVLDGLEVGEEIVVSAQFMLDSESRLQEALQKMREVSNAPADMNHDHPMDMPEAAPPAPAEHHH